MNMFCRTGKSNHVMDLTLFIDLVARRGVGVDSGVKKLHVAL